jgi:transcriptional regulator with XRE-family HTH domain
MAASRNELVLAATRLRKWRASEGLSQMDAARLILASQNAWSAWEQAKKAPDVHHAFAIERLTRGRVKARDWAALVKVDASLKKAG